MSDHDNEVDKTMMITESGPDYEKVLAKSFSAKFRNKYECYKFLTVDVKAYQGVSASAPAHHDLLLQGLDRGRQKV